MSEQEIIWDQYFKKNYWDHDVTEKMAAIRDFKSALKAKIEERLYDKNIDTTSWRIFQECLEYLDTCKPVDLTTKH